MKKLVIFTCLFFSVLVLYAKPIQEDYRKAEEKARVSYAFGMIIGANLGSLDMDFDYAAFAEGVKAMLEDMEPQFSEQEAIELIETAMHDAMERVTAVNRQEEEAFLMLNSQREEVIVTQSGLQYEILVDAEGEKPKFNSVVKVNYEGLFRDGTLFDKSDENEGSSIPLEMVISGWTEGLMLMSPGSTYRFYIPSNLAYGKDGIQGVIPPYSTLIFTVDLLEIINFDEGDDEAEEAAASSVSTEEF